MKNKFFTFSVIIAVIVLTFTTSCAEKKEEMVNLSFGKYNGIYQLKNSRFKVFHNGNMIYFYVLKDGNTYGMNSTPIEENTAESDEYKLEFTGNSLKVESNFSEISSGEYKKVSGYSTDEIYKDYVGDISLFDNKYNGRFEKDGLIVNTVQINNDELRLMFNNEEMSVNITIEYIDDNHFSTDFFDEHYDVKFDNDQMNLTITSDDESKKEYSNKYIRNLKLTKEEIIKLVNY